MCFFYGVERWGKIWGKYGFICEKMSHHYAQSNFIECIMTMSSANQLQVLMYNNFDVKRIIADKICNDSCSITNDIMSFPIIKYEYGEYE